MTQDIPHLPTKERCGDLHEECDKLTCNGSAYARIPVSELRAFLMLAQQHLNTDKPDTDFLRDNVYMLAKRRLADLPPHLRRHRFKSTDKDGTYCDICGWCKDQHARHMRDLVDPSSSPAPQKTCTTKALTRSSPLNP